MRAQVTERFDPRGRKKEGTVRYDCMPVPNPTTQGVGEQLARAGRGWGECRPLRTTLKFDLSGRTPTNPWKPANPKCKCSSPLFSFSQRASQRRQGTHSFWFPSFHPQLLAPTHILVGFPASDPG